ncbi:MAG: hypothetical protein VB133_12695 [Anaeromusa sp.]|uniref:hypothetical protein n=1 Tax=Anaeromusa sp. TaxID=1872520 RepID=UPI002B1FA9E1|nr:hypothetical protein [Anaeromusa sp.]MEA4835984.1 hypothetical protein [Anaeromusa sp.]
MDWFEDPQREVCYRTMELLATVDEALGHMEQQLAELRLEESMILFQDVATAIGSIIASALPLLKQEEDDLLLQTLSPLRESISCLVDCYEQEDLQAVQTVLASRLLPAYRGWRDEVERRLRPFVLT